MKWMGAFLLLSAGYLLGRRLAWPEICHVELLSEGEFLFRVLESEIRSGKIPLPELFEDLARRTDSPWRPFLPVWRKNCERAATCSLPIHLHRPWKTIWRGL